MNPGTETWIGVLGGGQLGRMLALDARRMGFKVVKWTGGDTSGAAETADLVISASFQDHGALDHFLSRVDIATVEFENVPKDLLHRVQDAVPLMPNADAVAICQHRQREKTFFKDNGFPCVQFEVVEDPAALGRALRSMPGDAIVKTSEFGYDGKGQRPASRDATQEEVEALWNDLSCPAAIVEEKIDLASEASVIVVRGQDGAVAAFDAAENQHRNHILDVSIVPARLPDALLEEARTIATRIAETLDYMGVLATEFFISRDGRLLVNELAPRPHNSGHHTIDACATSQFEQQARAVTGIPLGSTELLRPAVMWNLLGDLWVDATTPPDWSPILGTEGASLHLYGKSEAREGRKMGHATFLGATIEDAIARASACREQFGLPAIT